MKYLLVLLLLLASIGRITAQEISFNDTIKKYDKERMLLNARGMRVLEGWGAANIAAGGSGYFLAKSDEWKYFHAMNFTWGVVNTSIAMIGFRGVRRQAAAKFNPQDAYKNYVVTRKIYLVNIGLDAVYIAGGAGLMQYGKKDKANPALEKGFGESILMQGVFLLVFDNIMFAGHQQYHSRWMQLLNEMKFTGNGISYNF